MPVSVHIPLRIRTDAETLHNDPEGITALVGRGVSRAVENSRKQVLEPRGHYYGIRLHSPEFSWTGANADSVPEYARRSIQRAIAASLRQTLEASGLREYALGGTDSAVPLTAPPRATAADREFVQLLRTYLVRSYDAGGATVPVPVQSAGERRSALPTWHYVWHPISSSLSLENLMDELLGRMDDELDLRSMELPASGQLGAIFRSSNGIMAFVAWKFPEGTVVSQKIVPMQRLFSYNWSGSQGEDAFRRGEEELPAGARYHIRYFREVNDAQSRQDALREHWGPLLSKTLRDKTAAARTRLTQSDYDSIVDHNVETALHDVMTNNADARCFLLLTVDGTRQFLIGLSEDFDHTLDCELLSLVDVANGTPAGGGDAAASAGPGVGTGAGSATGSGTGTGVRRGRGGRGGFVDTGEPAGDKGGAYFPRLAPNPFNTEQLSDEAFLDEPALDQLGADGVAMQTLIDGIAWRLQMPKCKYAARFLLNAGEVMGGRATAIGTVAATEKTLTTAVNARVGNLGYMQFHPTASPGIQLMQHLAGVTPLIDELHRLIDASYFSPAHIHLMPEEWASRPSAWRLRFQIELADRMKVAVGTVFVMSCRVLLLQLLRASRESLMGRLRNFATYSTFFAQVVRTQLAPIDELLRLRTMLQAANTAAAMGQTVRTSYGTEQEAMNSWNQSTRELTGALAPTNAPAAATPNSAPTIVEEGSLRRVRDSIGVLWTMEQIETAIATQRGNAEAIDPLVKQLTDIPEVVARLRVNDVSALRRELLNLLSEMLEHNREITEKTSESWMYAFQASRISESIPQATIPYTSYALGGIHLQVHNLIGSSFGSSSWYAMGVDSLFSAELGRLGLMHFFEFVGLVLISVICPVAGFIVGVAVSAVHLAEAYEKQALFNSLIDPELVITRAEVEAEIFGAWIGMVLSFLPEVGSIVKGGAFAGKVALRAGVTAGVRSAGRAIARRASREIAERLTEELFEHFIKELAQAYLINYILEKALEPLLAAVQRETMVTGSVGGTQGAAMVRAMIAQELREQRGGH